VALLDYVEPSPQGTSWGLGGTCVNVGCIPKKLLHNVALLGEARHMSKALGWKTEGAAEDAKDTLDWEAAVAEVANVRMSSNFMYKVALRDNKVKYINAMGSMVDAHTVCVSKDRKAKGQDYNITADNILICPGGRPNGLHIPGGELSISSDDLFQLPASPGRVVVIGASYVALECAGFLHGLGLEVTVIVRSILLRGFDQEFAEKIGADMAERGIKFIRGAVPVSIEEGAEGKTVAWKSTSGEEAGTVVADTILNATGRTPATASMNLAAAGVETNAKGEIVTPDLGSDATTAEGVYAIGDAVARVPELTPVAIKAGLLLADRLYAGSKKRLNYDIVPTAIFTPLEYGAVGLSEEDARARYGDARVEAYVSNLTPIEWSPPGLWKPKNKCSAKALVLLPDDAEERLTAAQAAVAGDGTKPVHASEVVPTAEQKVIGLHFFGPNAGEIMQGYAVALKVGVSWETFQDTIGIHPTTSEEFIYLTVRKSSGQSADKQLCCG